MNYPNVTLNANISQIYEINKEGELLNAYAPLLNLMTSEDIGDFTTDKLNLSVHNPVDIIITDEYDGSQNLIVNDDVNEPRLINSRMSVLENHKFKLPLHSGNCVTNVYDNNTLDKDVSLLKLYNTIPSLLFDGLLEGGALKCGSYVFYFKLSDSDGNLTTIILESAPVTIHVGPICSTKVRMGMLDENAEKRISFTLSNLDSGFDYVKVFFERSSSDNSGATTTLFYMVDQNYPIVGNRSQIIITGEEEVISVSRSDILNEFADIQAAKTHTILHNTLFLGNVQASSHDYDKLQQLAWKIIPREVSDDASKMKIGGITGNYDLLSSDGSQKGMYYNVHNLYHYTGYWPDEYYRFGVVFIFNNNLTSPVFNIQGVDFASLKNSKGEPITSWDNSESEGDYINILIPDLNAPYSAEPEDYIFNKQFMTNSKGVIKFGKRPLFDGIEDTFVPRTYGIMFDLLYIGLNEGSANLDGEGREWLSPSETLLKHGIKGLFFVRQKRVPSILAQGLVIGLTGKEHGSLPVLKNKYGVWSTYSFLGGDRLLHAEGSEVEIPSRNVSKKAVLVPDFEVNTATYNQIFTGNKFAIERVANIEFAQLDTSIIPSKYNNRADYRKLIAKATAVPQDSLIKTDGVNYFATMAGIPEEPYKTEDVVYAWNKTAPQNLTVSTSVVRGKWGSYVGISSDAFSYGDIINIRDDLYISNPNYNLLLFQKRFTDSSFYSAISLRYNYNDGDSYTCYRGDCFPSMFTHRMMSNFQDPELPTNRKIIDPGCWAKNYAVRCTAEILATTHSNLTDDSAGWYIQSPIDKKSNVVSLIFGILTGNIGTVLNAVKNMTDHKEVTLSEFSNEVAQAFEVYTGVDGQSTDQKTYNPTLYKDIDSLYDTVAAGYIKKVNPKELETNFTGLNLKALFKSDDKWELHGLAQINRADVNAVSFGQWITFPICSSTNLAFRDVDFNQATEEAKYNRKRSFYPLEEKDITNNLNESQVINGACRKSMSKLQTPVYRTVPYIKLEFFNRIYWSKPNTTDSVINSYRMIFKDLYREYNKEFGSITKLESLGDHLVIIFQHGIGLLPVNRAVNSEADASPYLASKNVLPAQLSIITPDYGSMWKDSILKVPDSPVLFGVDTVARKIWKLSTNGIEFISDHVVTKFLNDFIDLSEYDFKEYLGHINVKTHYNAFKKDVIFTYYKDVWDTEKLIWKEGTTWSLCYNLVTNTFTTFYDWIPIESCNIDNIYFSFDRDLIDSVLDKKVDDVKVYPAILKDDSKEASFYLLSKSLIDPQFSEKCKVYPVTGRTYLLEGRNDEGCYLCYYIKGQEGWQFQYTEIKSPSDFTINTEGIECVADLKTVKLKSGITTKAELPESDPMYLYNLRNSTPNRMLLWKHGQAGLYDNQGKIKPTHWYGKQHEFNFEFVVNENPVKQKIFNNLKLLSNKAAPAKFEYEVVGEGYEWFEYKPIVEWINKQASITKTLDDWYKEVLGKDSATLAKDYPDFPKLFDEARVIKKLPYLKMRHTDKKGTPERPHYKWDNGKDYWNDLPHKDLNHDDKYSYNCSEPCLVEDDQLNEVRLRTESLGNDIRKYGRIRGNMQYLEDLWNVEIRPVQITWCDLDDKGRLQTKKVTETKHRDKYLKVKVRYSGEDLALILAIYTIFDESYA